MSPSHYVRGWHITATCGVFGAAATAAKALGLDEQSIVCALGNAAAQSSGLVQTLGTAAKSIGVGNAASNGLLSALLAEQGFDGPDEVLAGVCGYLNVASEAPDFDAVLGGLGSRWELPANTYSTSPTPAAWSSTR